MLLVLLSHLWLPHLEQLDYPARIEIDHEADTAAILGQMLNGQAQTTWPGRTKRQPVSALRKKLIRKRVTECLVVKPKILDVDPRFWNAGTAAGFEGVHGTFGITARYPAPHRATTQPFVLEGSQLIKILIRLNSLAGIPTELLRVV